MFFFFFGFPLRCNGGGRGGGWTVGLGGGILTDEDGPDVDEDKQDDICDFLQREDEREDVVRHALGEPVHRMKRVACERRGHDPFVMRLVKPLVHGRVVQGSMDPVYEEVRKGDEEGELEEIVQGERGAGRSFVELREPTNFGDKERNREHSHAWKRSEGLLDFLGDLVFKVFGMGEGRVVEYEQIGHRGAQEIDH